MFLKVLTLIPMVTLRTEAYGRDGLIGLRSLVGILWWETDGGMPGHVGNCGPDGAEIKTLTTAQLVQSLRS